MTKLSQVYFIVNANPLIGFGHLIRCVLLAKEFNRNKIETIFLSYEIDEVKNNKTEEFKHIKCKNLTDLFEVLTPKLNNNSLVVIDTDDEKIYDLNYQEKIISTKSKLMYISVKNHLTLKSHFILNQNIMGLDNVYYSESYTKKLLGPNYFILDESFKKIKPLSNSKEISKVLITCGNSDPNNVTLKILDFLNRLTIDKNLLFNIVVGGENKNADKIYSHPFCENNQEKVTIHYNCGDMYSKMKKSDLAISTIGLTYWELVLHNIPCLLVSGSKREKDQIQYFTKNKYAYYLGDYDDLDWNEKWGENYLNFNRNNIDLEALIKAVNVNGKSLIVNEVLKEFI